MVRRNWGNATMPTLAPWRVVTTFGADADKVTLERNPFYWKVDPDGRQLPYIDNVEYRVSRDIEPTLLQIMNGEIDLEFHRASTNKNKPVLAREREAVVTSSSSSSPAT